MDDCGCFSCTSPARERARALSTSEDLQEAIKDGDTDRIAQLLAEGQE